MKTILKQYKKFKRNFPESIKTFEEYEKECREISKKVTPHEFFLVDRDGYKFADVSVNFPNSVESNSGVEQTKETEAKKVPVIRGSGKKLGSSRSS
jgi:hypothetical protein